MYIITATDLLADIRELADITGTSGSVFLSDAKLLRYANSSRGVWHSKLAEAVPDRFAAQQTITADGSSSYTLPKDWYSTLFVDRLVGSTDRVPLLRLMPHERNDFGRNTGDARGYELIDRSMYLYPIPTSGTYYHRYVRRANRFVATDTTFTTTHASELVNSTAHGLVTGDGPIRLRTTADDLPAGYSADTDYWIIYVSANTFKLATSYDNAIAGTAVSITDDGTGTHTYYGYVDGINGWERWIVYDVAIFIKQKQNSDVRQLVDRQNAIEIEMRTAAEERVKGDVQRVVDVRPSHLRGPRDYGAKYGDIDFWR